MPSSAPSPLQLLCQTADAWERSQASPTAITPTLLADALGEHLDHQGIPSTAVDRQRAACQVMGVSRQMTGVPDAGGAKRVATSSAKPESGGGPGVAGLFFTALSFFIFWLGGTTHDTPFMLLGGPPLLLGVALLGLHWSQRAPSKAPRENQVTLFTRGDD